VQDGPPFDSEADEADIGLSSGQTMATEGEFRSIGAMIVYGFAAPV
jgi:hypothetical protein